ncbi:hypothetical protein GCM10022205_43820 [Spinactinospora alkalitolerans]
MSFLREENETSVEWAEPRTRRELDTVATVHSARVEGTTCAEGAEDTVADEHTSRNGASGASPSLTSPEPTAIPRHKSMNGEN